MAQCFDHVVKGVPRGALRVLYFVGDFHAGTENFARDECIKDIHTIAKDKYAQVIVMGDLIEAIVPYDKRFDPDNIDQRYFTQWQEARIAGRRSPSPFIKLVDLQVEDIVKILKPIADKIIGIHGGNHEYAIVSKFGGITDPLERIINGLNDSLKDGNNPHRILNYGYERVFTRIFYKHSDDTGSNCVIVDTAHGQGGGRKTGAKVNRLVDELSGVSNVQILARGHTHALFKMIVPRLKVPTKGKCEHVEAEYCTVVSSGSYYRTYSPHGTSYGERALLLPVPLGCVKVTFHVGPFRSVD